MNETNQEITIPRLGVEEMIMVGFHCCANVERRMVCVHAKQLLVSGGSDPKMYCMKMCRPVSIKESFGCTNTKLIPIQQLVMT